jgi:hypothetical protein
VGVISLLNLHFADVSCIHGDIFLSSTSSCLPAETESAEDVVSSDVYIFVLP